MMRPRVVRISMRPDFFPGVAGAELPACTSDARISPPEPDPRIVERSTPSSLASRRAFGEIFMPDGGACGEAPDGPASGDDSACKCDPPRAAGAGDAVSSGGASPAATIHAIVCPTGMSAPTMALMPARIPSAGASTSTTALSVSISRSGSPLVTRSPPFFRQARSLPVSCAISRAGITTLKAIVFEWGKSPLRPSARNSYPLSFCAGLDHLEHALAGRSFGFSRGRQRTVHRVIVRARHQKLLCGKARNDFVPRRSDHDFFFNARRAPAIGRRPECFKRENHARLDFHRMLERNETADDRLLPDRQPDAVSVLQSES